jgi:hypothetical protein
MPHVLMLRSLLTTHTRSDTLDTTTLLELPDPCLLAVLQCCADDLVSMFSAARAHSRLHQAAVQALSSMTVDDFAQQHQLDVVLLYLLRHGQHVNNLDLGGGIFTEIRLLQLPDHLKLHSLRLSNIELQLQPGSGFKGLVRPGLPLKQLRLYDCKLLDGEEGLAAALALLPGLQHLLICNVNVAQRFPTAALSALHQLTHLELDGAEVSGPDEGAPALQPLRALTALARLRLSLRQPTAINSSMLSGAQHLTRLELTDSVFLELGALAALTQLQHLQLYNREGRAMAAQLLSQLPALQQLTYLQCMCDICEGTYPHAAAFSALTASSKLQHLNVANNRLPAGVWQHVFPDGRQLPQLTSVRIAYVTQLGSWDTPAPAPEGTRLVSCCPALQCLDMWQLQYIAERLTPLAGLSGLHTLRLHSYIRKDGLEAVCQLTGLRELTLGAPGTAEGLLLQLAQLKQLTRLDYVRIDQSQLLAGAFSMTPMRFLPYKVGWQASAPHVCKLCVTAVLLGRNACMHSRHALANVVILASCRCGLVKCTQSNSITDRHSSGNIRLCQNTCCTDLLPLSCDCAGPWR